MKKINHKVNLLIDIINCIVYNINCKRDTTNPKLNERRRETKKMCKANSEIENTVTELMEIRKMIEELQTQAETLTDSVKAYMGDEETMLVGSWKITYRETVSKRIDSTELKKVLGDCLDPYYKTVITRPFRIV